LGTPVRGLGAPEGLIAGWDVDTGARTVAETGAVVGVCATGALASTGRRPVVRGGGAGVFVGGLATFDALGNVAGGGRMLKTGGLGARGGGVGALGVVCGGGCGRTTTTGFTGLGAGAFATTGTYTGLAGAATPGPQPIASGDFGPD